MATDDRIVDWAEYGEMIPLRCKNHPEKRWHTKNILCIGARSVFYNLMSDWEMGSECPCPASDLEPVPPE